MERQFIIPGTIAAGLHLGVLFGFPASPATVVVQRPPEPTGCELVFQPLAEPPPASTDLDRAAGGARDVVRPSLPEQPVATKDDGFKMDTPPITTSIAPGPIDRIDPRAIGPGNGDEPVSNPGGIVSSIFLDNTPRAVVRTPPQYPFEAKRLGQGGSVLVEFTVDESGAVRDPHIVKSTDRMFEEPTLRAVTHWRFEAGKRGGETVRYRMALPVEFHLEVE